MGGGRCVRRNYGVKVELARSGAAPKKAAPVPAAAPTLIPTPARTARAPEDGLVEVLSPLLGVFYRAPKPGEPPFVEVGQFVEDDTIVGIVEVMKLMNSVTAGVRGVVTHVLADNAQLVEPGQPLVGIRPA